MTFNRDLAEQRTGTAFAPILVNPDTGNLKRMDTKSRIEVWEWIMGYRLASNPRTGTIYIRDTEQDPWREINWDIDTAYVRAEFNTFVQECRFVYDPPLNSLKTELSYVASQTSYDPILDTIDRLEWDGRERLFTELADRIEWSVPEMTDDKPATDLAIAVIFLGGVERAHKAAEIPLAPILYGGQGVGKTATIKAIASLGEATGGALPYYGSILPTSIFGLLFRDNLLVKREGKIVTELKEVDGLFTESNESLLKALFDESGMSWRSPYAHSDVFREYTDILIGTTNESDMFTDFTGNRRFIPVKVEAVTKDIDDGGLGWRLDLHPEIVQQLWAEANHMYNNGTTWRDFYTDEVRMSLAAVTAFHTRRNAYYDLALDTAATMLADDRCRSGSVSISKVKETLATTYPYMRKLLDSPWFESRLKQLAPSHNLAVVRRHHRWGDEPRTSTCAGLALENDLLFDEVD